MVLGGWDTSPEVVGGLYLGPGVMICGKITLGHPQKSTKRRERADSGTFSDLNHLLERVERSELVLGGRDTSLDVVRGLYWGLG